MHHCQEAATSEQEVERWANMQDGGAERGKGARGAPRRGAQLPARGSPRRPRRDRRAGLSDSLLPRACATRGSDVPRASLAGGGRGHSLHPRHAPSTRPCRNGGALCEPERAAWAAWGGRPRALALPHACATRGTCKLPRGNNLALLQEKPQSARASGDLAMLRRRQTASWGPSSARATAQSHPSLTVSAPPVRQGRADGARAAGFELPGLTAGRAQRSAGTAHFEECFECKIVRAVRL